MAGKRQDSTVETLTMRYPDAYDGEFSVGEFTTAVNGGVAEVPAEHFDAAITAGFRAADDGAAEPIDDGFTQESSIMGNPQAIVTEFVDVVEAPAEE
jgi:hypothetical protein